MFNLSRTLGTLALALAGLGLQAEDFQPLMAVAKTTWPEKSHIGVVCDYRASRPAIEALATAAGPEAWITVVDVHISEQVSNGASFLAMNRPDYLVLLPGDPVTRDGSLGANLAVRRLATRGIPAVGTTPKAMEQGAAFSLGDGTRGELLVTNKLIGTVDVILPDKVTFSKKASLLLAEANRSGMAKIVVVSAK